MSDIDIEYRLEQESGCPGDRFLGPVVHGTGTCVYSISEDRELNSIKTYAFSGGRLDSGRPQPMDGAVLHHTEWTLYEFNSESLQLTPEGIHVGHDSLPMLIL